MTDDIPAGKVEAVAKGIDSAARAPMSEIMARGIPRYALIAIAAIRAADAWDAANRHAAMHGNDAMHVRVGTINAPKWWAD